MVSESSGVSDTPGVSKSSEVSESSGESDTPGVSESSGVSDSDCGKPLWRSGLREVICRKLVAPPRVHAFAQPTSDQHVARHTPPTPSASLIRRGQTPTRGQTPRGGQTPIAGSGCGVFGLREVICDLLRALRRRPAARQVSVDAGVTKVAGELRFGGFARCVAEASAPRTDTAQAGSWRRPPGTFWTGPA